jgi:tetratricopeptide (TPR) repeat protein
VVAVLGLVAWISTGCGSQNPDELSYRARAAFDAGRAAEAEAHLVRLARIRWLTTPERLLLSRIASDRGRIEEALAVLDNATLPSKGPEAALIAARRGQLELERHRFRAAEAELKRALALDPGCIDARRRLTWLYMQQGRSAEIAAHSLALAKSTKLNFLDLLVWTLARHEPLDTPEVAQVLEQAIQVDAGDRASRLALAEHLRRLGRLNQTNSTLASLPPNDLEARAIRARVALDRGDSAGADALLGIDSESDTHAALGQLRGRLALGRGNASAAVRHFRAALKADPDDRDARFGLGQALRLAGQVDAARPYIQAARAEDRLEWLVQSSRFPNRRNDPEAMRAIAEACLVLGRRNEACGWYRLALSLAPNDPTLQSALSALDSTLGQAAIPDGKPPQ